MSEVGPHMRRFMKNRGFDPDTCGEAEIARQKFLCVFFSCGGRLGGKHAYEDAVAKIEKEDPDLLKTWEFGVPTNNRALGTTCTVKLRSAVDRLAEVVDE